MRLRRCVLTIFLVFLVYIYGCSSSGGDVTHTSPENLLKAFSAAIHVGDEGKAKAEALCTLEFWKKSGKRFFKQAARKKFEMIKNSVQSKGEKAVVTADLVREGKVVDQVYFYAVKKKHEWRIDGMDENKNHIDHYLAGRLPARFDLSDFPGNPKLEELGKKLIEIAGPLKEAADDTAKQGSILEGVLIGNPGSISSQLRLLLEIANMKLNVVSTHMIDSIQRGAIVIKDETEKEKVFIYVGKEADGWKLINCHTGWLSEESILR
jgi:hypothetical protein